jgi:hypothetical protein
MLKSNKLRLLQKMHDQFASRHLEVNKILKLFKRNHQWSKMIKNVKQFIKNCHICKKTKAARDKYQELLNSLSIFDRLWTNIILDFVIELLDSRNYNVILMIIDRLSKMHYYISCITNENETTVEETIKLFIQHVWKLHELFTTIIFNRESQFISLIWDIICKMLKIKIKLFTAFHSETDEQSEIFNQKMKRYLRVYVNHQQDDWADWLSMIEYVLNAFVSITTQVSSFLVNYDFEFRMNFDFYFSFNENTIRKRVQRFKNKKIVFIIKKIWTFAKKHMKKNQKNQFTHANRHRIFASDYQIEN